MWDSFGPPLRPSPQDTRLLERLAASHCTAGSRALLLGVTPEYALLPWPTGTTLTAVDRSADMIAGVWPATRVPATFQAVRGEWSRLPLPDASIDLAVGDGISTVLGHWRDFDAILREVRRVCKPGAAVLLRLFIKPQAPDDVERLMVDVETGRLRGFHAFKLRLLMALQTDLDHGIAPHRAWHAWQRIRTSHAACIETLGWAPGAVATIDAYAQSPDTYWFPTTDQARAALERHFVVRDIRTADYELGERCPVFVLARRP